MTISARVLPVVLTASAAPALLAAPAADDDVLPVCFRYADAQPTAPSAQPERIGDQIPPFGSAGSRWWTIGAGVAHDFNGSTDTDLNFAYSYFMATDVEFAAEAAGWHFNQAGSNTFGTSLSMVFRWHFLDSGPWTLYADAGIGFLLAEDVVPEGGTSFDFMPRAGVGFTRALNDSGLRLQMGVQWHHISNARIHGEENNPARDQPMLYAGIVFPF